MKRADSGYFAVGATGPRRGVLRFHRTYKNEQPQTASAAAARYSAAPTGRGAGFVDAGPAGRWRPVWAMTRFPMFCPNDQVIPQGNDRRLRRGHPGDEVRTPDTARRRSRSARSSAVRRDGRADSDRCRQPDGAPQSLVKRRAGHKDRGQDGRRPSRQHLGRTDFWTAACDASGLRPVDRGRRPADFLYVVTQGTFLIERLGIYLIADMLTRRAGPGGSAAGSPPASSPGSTR